MQRSARDLLLARLFRSRRQLHCLDFLSLESFLCLNEFLHPMGGSQGIVRMQDQSVRMELRPDLISTVNGVS